MEIGRRSEKTAFSELNFKKKLTKMEILAILYKNHKDLDLNFKDLDGNRTNAALFEAYQKIIELSGHGEHDFSKLRAQDIIDLVENVFNTLGISSEIIKLNTNLDGKELEQQKAYQLWHLLYSYEGDDSKTGNESLLKKLEEKFGFEKEYAAILANVNFEPDYAGLSAKAISKILPHLKDGLDKSQSELLAGYKHFNSQTKEERLNRELKDRLEILEKTVCETRWLKKY